MWYQFGVESWVLFSLALVFTLLRSYVRIREVGLRNLQADDYLTSFCVETSLSYSVAAVGGGLANNDMTGQQRLALSPEDDEYGSRVIGSKIQIAEWTCRSITLWSLKATLLVFYLRLTARLPQSYHTRVYCGFVFVVASWIAVVLTIYLGCRPFYKNWQVYPDPGRACQPAISPPLTWTYFSLNVVTDTYLISIPIPMLWQTGLSLSRKIGLTTLFSGGFLVIICAILSSVLILTHPSMSAQLAGSWAVRESFVAVITTNLLVLFPFIKHSLGPAISSFFTRPVVAGRKASIYLRTSGDGGDQQRLRRDDTRSPNKLSRFTFAANEEEMIGQAGVEGLRAIDPVYLGEQNHSDSTGRGVGWNKSDSVSLISGGSESYPIQGNCVSSAGPERVTSWYLS